MRQYGGQASCQEAAEDGIDHSAILWASTNLLWQSRAEVARHAHNVETESAYKWIKTRLCNHFMSRTKRQQPTHWLRHPKTTQEIRENEAARLEGHRVRRAGKKSKPPTAWDDGRIAATRETDYHQQKRWKRGRVVKLG